MESKSSQHCQTSTLFIFSGLVSIATSFISLERQPGTITLDEEPFNFIPRKFYIIDVADGKANRNVTAILFKKGKNSPVQVDLKDGAVYLR